MFTWLKNAISLSWKWLMAFTQFLDDKNGKFSFKRGIAIAAFITSVLFAARGDWFTSAIYFLGAIAIIIITAVTES